ncbi:MAG: AraC family transcriptional regulator [Oscillospiraceae bacterium]|nr:AraC family transcriptional regulator [Oscillospiraceae bacterium]
MDLLTQLNRAMQYIEENICNDIELGKVSQVTNYSPYHFGRLFYYITDMPISEYIRKRKLSLAAMELQTNTPYNSGIKVIDLAVKYGYDSADSFTKAFIKQHGVTPTEARRSGVVLKLFPPITFQIKIQGVQGMNWRIEEREAFEVFGIERIFKDNETTKVPAFWDELQQNGKYEKLIKDAGEKKDMFGSKVCTINALCGEHEEGSGIFPYMLFALKTDNSNIGGYKIKTVPKATWVVFRANDVEYIGSQIGALFQRAYSEWLPSSGYDTVGHGPDLEIYGEHFEEVWIPVMKK